MDERQILSGLNDIKGWNDFAASLVSQWHRKGDLSDRQWIAGQKMLEKIASTKAKQASNRTELDASRIEELLHKAVDNGMRRPVFRAMGLSLSLAGPNSRNAGAVYVKASGEYQGKIVDGKFVPGRDYVEGVGDKLKSIAADPRGAAIDYGRETGNCACCGRMLTNKASIELGIGPICAERWGL